MDKNFKLNKLDIKGQNYIKIFYKFLYFCLQKEEEITKKGLKSVKVIIIITYKNIIFKEIRKYLE